MAQLKIQFELKRDSEGYELVDTMPSKPSTTMPFFDGGIGHIFDYKIAGSHRACRRGGNLSPIGSIDDFETLYGIFARDARTPNGALKFIQKYGSLTEDGIDPKRGDSIPYINACAAKLYEWRSKISHTHKSKIASLFSQRVKFGNIDVVVLFDPVTGTAKLQLAAPTLLNALWLQFAHAISSGANLTQCQHCKELFESGPGTGRRLDAKFCSDEHRITFNSLRRTKEK